MKNYLNILYILFITVNVYANSGGSFQERTVFANGQEGIFGFRIPSVTTAKDGTVLAFCEARKESTADCSPTDMVMKYSNDNGNTWSQLKLLADGELGSVTNPTSLVERTTGRIFLFFNRTPAGYNESKVEPGIDGNTVTAWVIYSDDNGRKWSDPCNITAQAKKNSWSSFAFGPGSAIQTLEGRIIVPCNHGPSPSSSFAIFSDDLGKSWTIGNDVAPNTNECQLAQLSDGSIMFNMRNLRGPRCRAISVSSDGGQTWSDVEDDYNLIEPQCQASLISYKPTAQNKPILLFSNPATMGSGSKGRTHLTVRISYDDGKSWPYEKIIYTGPSAYSCLTVLKDGSIGCLYEKSEGPIWGKNLRTIAFAKFDLNWLTDGRSGYYE
ncbi:MAG: sialidase family protein [Phycisphaerales bacterium]